MIFDERVIRNRQINRVYDKSERTMAKPSRLQNERNREICKYIYIHIYVCMYICTYTHTDASTRRSWKSSHGYRVEATGYSEPLRVSCAIRYPRIILPRFRSSCNVKRHCRQRMNKTKRNGGRKHEQRGRRFVLSSVIKDSRDTAPPYICNMYVHIKVNCVSA